MNGKDIKWSKEVKDFAAYSMSYSGVSDRVVVYLWNANCSASDDIQEVANSIMKTKEYKEIVGMLHRFTLYYGHDYVKAMIDIFKNDYGVEVTA